MVDPPVEALAGWGCPCAPERQGRQRLMGAEGATRPQPSPWKDPRRPRVRMRRFGVRGQLGPWRLRPEPSLGRERGWSLKPRRAGSHAAQATVIAESDTADNLSKATRRSLTGLHTWEMISKLPGATRGSQSPQWNPEVPGGPLPALAKWAAGPGRLRGATPQRVWPGGRWEGKPPNRRS